MKTLRFLTFVFIFFGFASVMNAQKTFTEKVTQHIENYPVVCNEEYVSGDITVLHTWQVNRVGEIVSDRWVNQGGALISNLGNVYRFIEIWMDHINSPALNNGASAESLIMNYKLVGKSAVFNVKLRGHWVIDPTNSYFIVDRVSFETECP